MRPLIIALSLLAGGALGSLITAAILRSTSETKSQIVSSAGTATANVAIRWISDNDIQYTESVLASLRAGEREVAIASLEVFVANKTRQRDAAATNQAFELKIDDERRSGVAQPLPATSRARPDSTPSAETADRKL